MQRPFPQAAEAERALLGAMILDERARREALGAVHAADFYRADHRALFALLVGLHVRGEHIDLVSLAERIAQEGQDGLYGGINYVLALAEGVPSTANANYYAKIVHDRFLRRQMITSLQNTQEVVWADADAPLLDIRDQLVGSLLALDASAERRGWKTYEQIGRELLDHVLSSDPKRPRGLASGFDRLDTATGRMQPGEMVIICARPAMGKSAFALDLVEYTARNYGPVALFSLEMSDRQMFARSVTKQMLASVRGLMEGSIADDRIQDLEDVVTRLGGLPVFVDEQAGLTVSEIRARAQALRAMQPELKLIVIDYLQIVSAENPRAPMHEQIAAISGQLKRLAKDMQLPVVVLSQLNRASVERHSDGPPPRPTLTDMAGSDAIVKDADRVYALHRPRYYQPDNEGIPADLAEIIVLKCRNGIPGPITVRWEASKTQFSPWPEGRPIAPTPPPQKASTGRRS